MNNFDELFGRAVTWLLAAIRIDKVVSDMVLQHDGKQAIHRSATTRNSLQNVGAAMLFLKRPLDGFNLPLDPANPVEKFLFFLNRMTHHAPQTPLAGRKMNQILT